MSTTATAINGDVIQFGLLLSKNYPAYESNGNYIKSLVTSSSNKAFKIYITDLNIESTPE